MVLHEQVADKLQTLPEPLLREVEDFIDFLLTRHVQSVQVDDLTPEMMTQLAATGGAFDWLLDPAEDGLYSDKDGEPI